MIYVREFESYSSDDYMLAVPCDMSGGTFGATLEEAAESAADWLFETITDHLIANEVVPGGELGHEPVRNGKVIAIVVKYPSERAKRPWLKKRKPHRLQHADVAAVYF